MQTRRDFVKASAAVSAAVLGGSAQGVLAAAQAAKTDTAAGKGGSKMRFGLVTYLWAKDWDLPTVLANCRKAGYPGVELRVEHAHKVEPNLTMEQRKEVRKRFADSGIIFVGPGTNEQYDHLDPLRLAQAVTRTYEYIKLSHDCGGIGVKVKPNNLHKEVPQEKTCEQIGKSLNLVGRIAADYGQVIRVEVHGDCAPLPIMKQIFDFVEHPAVKMCWNCNDEDLGGQGLEANFNLVKDRFADTVHVRELNIGKYPYQQLIDLFVRMDYKGWILLEARTTPKDPIAALIEQRQVFEKMVKDAQGRG